MLEPNHRVTVITVLFQPKSAASNGYMGTGLFRGSFAIALHIHINLSLPL